MTYEIIEGDCREVLRTLPGKSVQCVITSPPYFGLRSYNGGDAEIGTEATPTGYVARMVAVFEEVKRVLRDDGTLWLNLGDSYAASRSNNGGYSDKSTLHGFTKATTKGRQANESGDRRKLSHGLKQKDLIGIPWRVAFALQDAGWYLRADVIWSKPNPMPESVTDRPTKAHEYVFLLTKKATYYYDADAIKEPSVKPVGFTRRNGAKSQEGTLRNDIGTVYADDGTRNARSVWTIATEPTPFAHFATMPTELVKPCILAGSREGDTVLDPFAGAGTVGLVALRHNRNFVGVELNPGYVKLAQDRIVNDAPLFHWTGETV